MAGFGIPDGYGPGGTIVFGYPGEEPKAREKNKPFVKWIR